MCKEGWELPKQKLDCCLVGLQISVRSDWQVSWVLLTPKYILGIQIAAMFYFKHSFHYRSMFQCQKSRFSHAMNTDKTSLDPIGRKMVQLAPTMLAWEHQTTECSCCHCQFTGKEQEDQCYSHQCKRNKQVKMMVHCLQWKVPSTKLCSCKLHTRNLTCCMHTACRYCWEKSSQHERHMQLSNGHCMWMKN